MKRVKKLWVVFGVVLIIAAAASIASKYYKPSLAPRSQVATAKMEADKAHDRQILQQKDASEVDLKRALMRLSVQREKVAEDMDLVWADSDRSERRAQAARALGFFVDPQAESALKKLLNDSEPAVRLVAMEAFTFHNTPERAVILRQTLERKEPVLLPTEKVLIYSALAKAPSSSVEQKKESIDSIFSLLQSPDKNAIFATGVNQLASVVPKEPRLLSLVTDGLLKAKVSPLDADSRSSLVTSLRVLHLICPPNRAALIEGVLAQGIKDEEVLRTALTETQFLKKEDAIRLLDAAIEKKWVPAGFNPEPEQLKMRIAHTGLGSICKD